MKQQARVFKLHETRRRAGERFVQGTHRQYDFNRRLDAVVQRFLETRQRGFDQSADADYAMRWAAARHLRIQSSLAKGEHHVAA